MDGQDVFVKDSGAWERGAQVRIFSPALEDEAGGLSRGPLCKAILKLSLSWES